MILDTEPFICVIMPKPNPDDPANRAAGLPDKARSEGFASFKDLTQGDAESDSSSRQTYGVNYHVRSAYGQLILLVFVPICVLSLVGASLVLYETGRAARALQQAQAQNIYARYNPAVAKLLSVMDSREGRDRSRDILQSMLIEQNLKRAAVIAFDGRELVKIGPEQYRPWPDFPKNRQFVSGLKSAGGTAYGFRVGYLPSGPVWLFVELDNLPLRLSHLRVLFALTVTGLITLLLLILCLNIYSKRWIAPIYEMRLHLQGTSIANLYRPISVQSSGELNLLQRDLVHLLRRLHLSFLELKEYSEQNEDDLRRAYDEMELQTISTRSARDEAIRANQAKSKFLANISHELRTPLNSIEGFINLLAKKQGLGREYSMYVQTIKKSSAHLLALVNDVLDFSKIEAGKLVLDEQQTDLYGLIYDVVDMLTPLASEKNLNLAVLYYEDVPRQHVIDALRGKQVLTNLVSNAIKFTESGEVLVSVELKEEQLPNGRLLNQPHLMISVQDTGIGIPRADRNFMFKSFSQGDPSITRQFGGSGLGLVISRQLAVLMGGEIGYFDNQDSGKAHHGSTFWFSLPIKHQIAELPAERLAKPVTVLCWIEHEASFSVLSGVLGNLGATVTKASSSLDVLNRIKSLVGFDWVIIDGGGDPEAMLKNLRAEYGGRGALFGYQIALDMAMLERYNCRALFQPINRFELIDLLNENKHEVLKAERWDGVHVLAVDDHLPNLLVLEALLGELGVRVTRALSGFEAIERYSEHLAQVQQTQKNADDSQSPLEDQEAPFDLIFMDIQMPRMSGIECVKQIRALDKNHRIPIIALTAHALADERDMLLAADVDDYVSKPINEPMLLGILKKWVDDQPVTLNETHGVLEEPKGDQMIFDWQEALKCAAGKEDLAKEILSMLIRDVPIDKAALLNSYAAKDNEQIAQIAHKLTGAARYTGTIELRIAAQKLQQLALSSVDESFDEASALFQSAFDEVILSLENLHEHDFSEWLGSE